MRNLGTALVAALASLLLATPTTCAKPNQPPGKGAILLSNVQALTLRTNRMTTSRRVSAAPQLKCIGHEKICKLYEIETMRCKNEGYDYDEEDIQWTCTASLPSEFKLGSTDVICEGYRNSDDPWVLKGSCGVEYRMLLTDEGEERFGKDVYRGSDSNKTTTMVSIVFWVLFIGVFVFIVAAACWGDTPIPREPRRRRRWGWGGGGGGGGGGGLEAEGGGRRGVEAGFDGVDGAEDELVDGVDYVVEEGLYIPSVNWGCWGKMGKEVLREECSGSVL